MQTLNIAERKEKPRYIINLHTAKLHNSVRLTPVLTGKKISYDLSP